MNGRNGEEMNEDAIDVCSMCCDWVGEMREGRSPATVRDTYPKMMRAVLKHKFGVKGDAARKFVDEACEGNWDRMHETDIERAADSVAYADMLLGDVWYCSDRWSWDRVIRVQWLYRRLCDKVRREERL